jgi:hypothetical protein
MADTVNTRNARFLLCASLGGTYVAINKTHGLNIQIPTDFSEDTGHGARFKSYLPGLQDFTGALTAWYKKAQTILEAMSLNKISEYFLIYPDFADSTNYLRGQCFVGQDGLNLDIGNTADESFTIRIANEDVDFIRNGTSILV